MRQIILVSVLAAAVCAACVEEVEVVPVDRTCSSLTDETARSTCYEQFGIPLTVLHTSDWHSRLLPYDLDVLATDERLGLLQINEPFGGAARMSQAIKRERSNAERVIHVDSGDCFQGAPIFNEFLGEVEIKAMNEIGVDAMVIGNHEFDNGVLNLVDKLSMAQFPVLAANYHYQKNKGTELAELGKIARPYTVIDADGLRIGVIGMANFSSLSSITFGDNGLGILPLESVQTVQAYVNILRPQVNVVVVLTHLGLGEDESVIRNTEGIDILFGGHLHVVLNPPKVIPDKTGKLVPLVHSGAFMKYLGRLDTVFTTRPEEPHNKELVSHTYQVVPIDSRLPEDADMLHLVTPYELRLAQRIDLRQVVGYTPEPLRRFGASGGDSPLGNFLSDAMLLRRRVEADIAATNSLGIRADINRGEITIDQMYNVFPFPNTITTMTLSGNELQELLDFNTFRSSGRGCATQLQVAGVEYDLDCDEVNRNIEETLNRGQIYEFAFRDSEISRGPCAQTSECTIERYPRLYDEDEVACTDDGGAVCNLPEGTVDVGSCACREPLRFAKNIRIIRGFCNNVSECTGGISVCSDNLDRACGEGGEYTAQDCRCREAVQEEFFYKFATNNYMARGGSGFFSLRFNTTQFDTGIDLRDAVIEQIQRAATCSERCVDEGFDPEFPGQCFILQACKQDLTAYNLKWCGGMDLFSEQDRCLELAGGARCLSLLTESDYDICLRDRYPDCQRFYYDDKIRECAENEEASQGLCASADKVSPFDGCVQDTAPACADASVYDPVSPFEDCSEFGHRKAELECPQMACPRASTQNRQRPIRPRNEEDGAAAGGAGGGALELMESLQGAGHDACY